MATKAMKKRKKVQLASWAATSTPELCRQLAATATPVSLSLPPYLSLSLSYSAAPWLGQVEQVLCQIWNCAQAFAGCLCRQARPGHLFQFPMHLNPNA